MPKLIRLPLLPKREPEDSLSLIQFNLELEALIQMAGQVHGMRSNTMSLTMIHGRLMSIMLQLTTLILLSLPHHFSQILPKLLGTPLSPRRGSIQLLTAPHTFPHMSRGTTHGTTGNLISPMRSPGQLTPTPPLVTTSTTLSMRSLLTPDSTTVSQRTRLMEPKLSHREELDT